MKKFSDFKKDVKYLDGEPIKIEDVIDKEILVLDHAIFNSKYNNDECLKIKFKLNEKEYVLNTGSKILREQINEDVEEFPFFAKIIKKNNYFKFV